MPKRAKSLIRKIQFAKQFHRLSIAARPRILNLKLPFNWAGRKKRECQQQTLSKAWQALLSFL
jgi:hypothetical protein